MLSPKARRWIAAAFAVLATAYMAICLAVYQVQDRLIYFPSSPLAATPSDIGLQHEELNLTTDDGVDLSAWFVPAREEQGVVLFCHGNAGNISHRLESLWQWHELGYSALIFDYRGYGKSAGRPTENGLHRDARAAWQYLTEERAIPPSDIVIFGRSLGGAVAAHLAARVKARAVILESTFTSLPDLGAEFYPYLPVRLITSQRYETKAELAHISAPLLLVHSRDDEVIPFAHGKELFACATEPKTFVPITGSHNRGFITSGEVYRKAIRQFLQAAAR